MHAIYMFFSIFWNGETWEKSRRDLDTMNYPTIKIPYHPIRNFNLK